MWFTTELQVPPKTCQEESIWNPIFKAIDIDPSLLQKSFKFKKNEHHPMPGTISIKVPVGNMPNLHKLFHSCIKAIQFQMQGDLKYFVQPEMQRIDQSWQLQCLAGKKNSNQLTSNDSFETLTDKRGMSAIHYLLLGGHDDQAISLLKDNSYLITKKDYHDRNLLHTALFSGSVNAIKYIDKQDRGLANQKDKNGLNALHYAALSGSVEVIQYTLLQHPKLATTKDKNDRNYLHYAVLSLIRNHYYLITKKGSRDVNVLNTSLSSGQVNAIKYVDEQDGGLAKQKTKKHSLNALHYAALSGSVEVIHYILRQHPKLATTKDKDGLNALHFAIMSGSVAAVKHILHEKPDLAKTKEKKGDSIIHYAVRNGSLDIIKFLLNNNPDIARSKDNACNTILHAAAESASLAVITHILETYPDLAHSKTNYGKNFFHCIICSGSVDNARYMLGKYPELANSVDIYGQSILFYALSWSQSVDMVKYLLTTFPQQAKVKDAYDRNILDCAARSGSIDLVKYVLSTHPQLAEDKSNRTGRNFLHNAAKSGSVPTIKFILEAYPDLARTENNLGKNLLHFTIESGRIDAIKYIMENHNNLNKKNEKNNLTTLHYAALSGSVDAFNFIHQKNPNLLTDKDDQGTTVLHLATRSGSLNLVKRILDLNKDLVNTQDLDGKNVLDYAAQSHSLPVLKFILNQFPELGKVTSIHGKNVLHYAAESQHTKLIEFILGKKPKLVNGTDNLGRTILHISAATVSVVTLRYILLKHSHLAILKDNSGKNFFHYLAESDLFTTENFRQLLVEHPEITASCWVSDNRGKSIDYIAKKKSPTKILNTLIHEALVALFSENISDNKKPWALNFLKAYEKKLLSFLLRHEYQLKPNQIDSLITKYRIGDKFSLDLTTIKPLLLLKNIDSQDKPLTKKLLTQIEKKALDAYQHYCPPFTKLGFIEKFKSFCTKMAAIDSQTLSVSAIQTLSIIVDDYQRNLTGTSNGTDSDQHYQSLQRILASKLLSTSTLSELRPKPTSVSGNDIHRNNFMTHYTTLLKALTKQGSVLKEEKKMLTTYFFPGILHIIEKEEEIIESLKCTHTTTYYLTEKLPLHKTHVKKSDPEAFRTTLHRLVANIFGAYYSAKKVGVVAEFFNRLTVGFCLESRVRGTFDWISSFSETLNFDCFMGKVFREYCVYQKVMSGKTQSESEYLTPAQEFIISRYLDYPCEKHDVYAPKNLITRQGVAKYLRDVLELNDHINADNNLTQMKPLQKEKLIKINQYITSLEKKKWFQFFFLTVKTNNSDQIFALQTLKLVIISTKTKRKTDKDKSIYNDPEKELAKKWFHFFRVHKDIQKAINFWEKANSNQPGKTNGEVINNTEQGKELIKSLKTGVNTKIIANNQRI